MEMEKIQSYVSAATAHFSPLPPSIAFGVFFSVAALLVVVFLFRRQNWRDAPPGPLGWPLLGYLPYLTDRLHEDLYHLAKMHGPIFSLRMGQKAAIVVSSPEVTKEILKGKDVMFSSRTITEAVRCVTYDATSLVFVPYGARWRLLRKIMTTELFSSKSLELLQPARKQQFRNHRRKIKQRVPTKGGLIASIATNHYFASEKFMMKQKATKSFTCSTSEVISCGDYKQTSYCHLLLGLHFFDQVEFVTSTFAFNMVQAFTAFEEMWEEICEDLRGGTLSNRISFSKMRKVVLDALLSPNSFIASKIEEKCRVLRGMDWFYIF